MRRLVFAAIVALAACAEAPKTYRDLDRLGREYQQQTEASTVAPEPQTAEQATAQDACGANRFRDLMGKPAADIDHAALPARARVIMPGQMVTMDFSATRLNIRVAPDGKVAALECF